MKSGVSSPVPVLPGPGSGFAPVPPADAKRGRQATPMSRNATAVDAVRDSRYVA